MSSETTKPAAEVCPRKYIEAALKGGIKDRAPHIVGRLEMPESVTAIDEIGEVRQVQNVDHFLHMETGRKFRVITTTTVHAFEVLNEKPARVL